MAPLKITIRSPRGQWVMRDFEHIVLNTLYCYGPLLICFWLEVLFLLHSAVISGLWLWFTMIWEWFPMFFVKLSQEKNIVEEIESIMGAYAEQSSPLWVCIPQKSLLLMISGIQTHLGELHFTQAPMMGFLFFSLFPLWCCCPASSWPLHELIPLINGGGHCQTIRISSCGPRLLHRQSHLLTAGCS